MISNKDGNKLTQTVFLMWNASRRSANPGQYIIVNTDIGFLATDGITAIRIPDGFEQPFKAGRPGPLTIRQLYNFFTNMEIGQSASRMDDIKLLPPDGRMAMKFEFGKDLSMYIDLTRYKEVPRGSSYDVLDKKLLRVYVEGEKLPVAVLAGIRVDSVDIFGAIGGGR